MNEYKTIRYELRGAQARITLNRPDKLNAINAAMMSELLTALDAAEAALVESYKQRDLLAGTLRVDYEIDPRRHESEAGYLNVRTSFIG